MNAALILTRGKRMDAKELAELLNGREYRNEITRDEEAAASNKGLVVVFGASDDLMEFRGAINDELDAYEGTTAFINADGLVQNECDNEHCPYARKLAAQAKQIKQVWDKDGYSWVFETTIPHSTFDVLEDGEKYCKGIVFYLSDVTA
jgi:agmatine/peptidylarginine deiminase